MTRVGTTIGPYRVTAELGSGGMGAVYRAEVADAEQALHSDPIVAIKVIHDALLQREGARERLQREAEIGRRVRHPNVVQVYGSGVDQIDGKVAHYLVLEFVEGQTLRALLDEVGPLPAPLCVHAGREVALGLEAIHAVGAIHRDLKPENVMVASDHSVKIMDLGAARLTEDAIQLSSSGQFVGSLLYAAPEQLRQGGADLDARCDLHALGVLLYELAYGRPPFDGTTVSEVLRQILRSTPRRLSEVAPRVGRTYDELVHVLLAKDRDERPATASLVAQILELGDESSWLRERRARVDLAARGERSYPDVARKTAVHGRDTEFGRLRAAFTRVTQGKGSAVLLLGEAGVGKTRLVDEFVRRLDSGTQAARDLNSAEGRAAAPGSSCDFHFVHGIFPPGGSATTTGPVLEAFRRHLGSRPHDALERYLPELPAMAKALGDALRSRGAVQLAPESFATGFVRLVQALAAEMPLVLFLDNVHEAPAGGRQLMMTLAMGLAEHRVLLLLSARRSLDTEFLRQLDALPQSECLDLPRLSSRGIARMLVDALGSKEVAREIGVHVGEQAGGNPHFALEILRALRRSGKLEQTSGGRWILGGAAGEAALPSSVTEAIRERLVGVERDGRQILDVAACCGPTFDPAVLVAVLELPRIAVLRELARLESRHRLVRASGRLYTFDHQQVCAVLREELPEMLREEYERRIGEALVAQVGDGEVTPALAADICRHLFAGGADSQAIEYLDAALAHLEGEHAFDAAAELRRRALAAEGLLGDRQRAEVLLRRARSLRVTGSRDRELDVLEEAHRAATAAGGGELLAEVCRRRGRAHATQLRFDEASASYREAVRLARDAEDLIGEARARSGLGAALREARRIDEALEEQQAALALARRSEDGAAVMATLRDLGETLVVAEDGVAARRVFAEAAELALLFEDAFALQSITGALGRVALSEGRYDDARRHLQRALRSARELGARRAESLHAGQLGNALLKLGRLDEARGHHMRAFVLARELGNRRREARALGWLASVDHARGRYAQSRERNRDCLGIARELGDGSSIAERLANLGGVCLQMGLVDEAREALEEGLEVARELEYDRLEARLLHVMGCASAAAGDEAQAVGRFRAALEIRRRVGNPSERVNTLTALAASLIRSDRVDEGRTLLTEALTLDGADVAQVLTHAWLAKLDPEHLAPACSGLAAHVDALDIEERMEVRHLLWCATGDDEHIDRARGLLRDLVLRSPHELREALLQNVALHRVIAAC